MGPLSFFNNLATLLTIAAFAGAVAAFLAIKVWHAKPATAGLISTASAVCTFGLELVLVLVLSSPGALAQQQPTPTATLPGPPTATALAPTATMSPTVPPTAATPPCQPGAVCYTADSKGIDSWGASGEWRAYNGYLMNDGSRNGSCTFPPTLTLPYSPTSPNYSITVQAQFPNLSSNGVNAYFCIYARLGPTSGYAAGVGGGGTKFINSSAGTSFNPGAPWFVAGSNWHTYRFDLNGPDLKFYIDGGLAVTGQDPSSLNVSGQIGLSDFVDVQYIKSIVVKGL